MIMMMTVFDDEYRQDEKKGRIGINKLFYHSKFTLYDLKLNQKI